MVAVYRQVNFPRFFVSSEHGREMSQDEENCYKEEKISFQETVNLWKVGERRNQIEELRYAVIHVKSLCGKPDKVF